MITERISEFEGALEELGKLCGALRERERTTQELRDEATELQARASRWRLDVGRQARTASRRRTAAIFGAFSTGKTTFLNAYLRLAAEDGAPPLELPVADEPTTALPVRLTWDPTLPPSGARGFVADSAGGSNEVPVEELLRLMDARSERALRDVEEVVIALNHPAVTTFDFLDLPGVQAAFFQEHAEIVKSRLRDAACVIWFHGGPDEQYPPRKELQFLRDLMATGRRPILGVWNGNQESGSGISGAERHAADEARAELGRQVGDMLTGPPHVLFCYEALHAARSGDLATRCGIDEFREALADEVDRSPDPSQTAEFALDDVRRQAVAGLRKVTAELEHAEESIEDDKADQRSDILRLEEAEDAGGDLIDDNARAYADDAGSSRLDPAIRAFVRETTSAGGGLMSILRAVKQGGVSPEKVKGVLEVELREKLEAALGFGEANGGWLTAHVEEYVQQTVRGLRARWRLFETGLKARAARRPGFGEADSARVPDEVKTPESVAASVAEGVVTETMKTLVGAIAVIAGILIAFATPKTFSPADVLGLFAALVGGGFMFNRLQARMLAQVPAAVWELTLRLRGVLRAVLLPQNDQLKMAWQKALGADDLEQDLQNLRKTRSAMGDLNATLKTLDFQREGAS